MISRRYRPWLTAVASAFLSGSAICIPAAAQTPDPNQILIKEFMFAPNPLTIKAGSTVTWVNMDDEPHTVVSNTRMFTHPVFVWRRQFQRRVHDP